MTDTFFLGPSLGVVRICYLCQEVFSTRKSNLGLTAQTFSYILPYLSVSLLLFQFLHYTILSLYAFCFLCLSLYFCHLVYLVLVVFKCFPNLENVNQFSPLSYPITSMDLSDPHNTPRAPCFFSSMGQNQLGYALLITNRPPTSSTAL